MGIVLDCAGVIEPPIALVSRQRRKLCRLGFHSRLSNYTRADRRDFMKVI